MNQRPWGNFRVLFREPGIQVKRMEVAPGLRFSLQKHLRRSEKWIIVSGKGVATLGDRHVEVSAGSFLDVPVGQVHRMKNTGSEPLVFVEVQFGDYLEEDDVVRLEDDFNRI